MTRLAMVPSVEDWKRVPLPAVLSPLQYLRPVPLAARYLKILPTRSHLPISPSDTLVLENEDRMKREATVASGKR